MKKYVMFLCCIGFATAGFSQTWAEWVSQKATQKKYLIQQIAALQIYIGYLEKGYSIAKSGLTAIGNIKDGHFNLDKDFFTSLHNINPKVKNYAKVADIIAMNIKIIQENKNTINSAKQSSFLQASEMSYMNSVFERLLSGCADLVDQLTKIVSAGKLQMSDDERIKDIDRIYGEMREKLVFASSFNTDISVLSLQRAKDQMENAKMRSLYDLP